MPKRLLPHFLLGLLLVPHLLFGLSSGAPNPTITKEGEEELEIAPWLTGPLITSSGSTVPKGSYDIEPYLFYTRYNSFYGNHWNKQSAPTIESINPIFINIMGGLTTYMDFQLIVQGYSNHANDAHFTHMGDMVGEVGFQLIAPKKGFWGPYLRLVVSEVFPIGKYQNLNPENFGTDFTGGGSFQTGLSLNYQQMFKVFGTKFLNIRTNFQFVYPAKTYVKGINAYGGGLGTSGNVYPGKTFIQGIGTELTLTTHWVAAIDFLSTITLKDRFSGENGIGPLGAPATVGRPFRVSLSLAPALEYNFNEQWGIIGGVWFTVAGKNTAGFLSSVIAFNYFH